MTLMEMIKIINAWLWTSAIFGAIIGSVFIHLIQKRSYIHAVLIVVAFAIYLIRIVG